MRAGAQPRKTDESEDDESTSESKSDVARGRDQDKKPQLKAVIGSAREKAMSMNERKED